ALSCMHAAFALSFEPHFELPANSGMYNVKTDFGAVGDGSADDTKALQAAFLGDSTKIKGGVRAVYIPAGTYLVKDSLYFGDKKKCIFGEGRNKVTIKLADNSPGYDDVSNPRYFIKTFNPRQEEIYLRADNFFINLRHLTIEIGNNNPGAIALGYHTNNSGIVYDIALKCADGQAYTGLDLTQVYPGPGFVKELLVDGFRYGIKCDRDHFSMAFENITINNSSVCGFYNDSLTVAIRNLTTSNCALAVRNVSRYALMTLVDANLSGSGATAIENADSGAMLARDISTSGYTSAVINFDGTTKSGPDIAEWTSHPILSLFSSPQQSLRLRIRETPELRYDDLQSCKVMPATGDITDSIQQAIDSGYSTIFIPHGEGRTVTKTIIVRNKLKRVMGLGNGYIKYELDSVSPGWRIEDGNSDVVMFEHVHSAYGSTYSYTYEHASANRTLVLRSVSASYRNVVDRTKLFIESSAGQPIHLKNAQAWVRDINTETYNDTHIVNSGSNLWVLGHKTEKHQCNILTKDHGKTEVLGGQFYKNNHQSQRHAYFIPCFIIDNASASLSYRIKIWQDPPQAGIAPRDSAYYKTHVLEIRGSDTRELPMEDTYNNRVPLFTGYDVADNITAPVLPCAGIPRFSVSTTGGYARLKLDKTETVRLRVYNPGGRVVWHSGKRQRLPAGEHIFHLGPISSAGVCVIVCTTGHGQMTAKVVLPKK
ncbi:MAG: hypothetical protein GF350_01970, partial [Chitinivibrionales bacterium]|nr:hypothetical protein [Chitinivibrionales bacterium]